MPESCYLERRFQRNRGGSMRTEIAPAELRKIPPDMAEVVSARGAWSFCALECARFGPIHLDTPGMPFHHIGLQLDDAPLQLGMAFDSGRAHGWIHRNDISILAADDGGQFWWNREAENACLYFTDAALARLLGRPFTPAQHRLDSRLALHSPMLGHLLRALLADLQAGQPHGALVGDAIFMALAAQLLPPAAVAHGPRHALTQDRLVQRALDYIHDHLTDASLNLERIAMAAASSPFHLSRCFRSAMGCSLWQYVLRERARLALALMPHPRLTLEEVAQRSGFHAYSSFSATLRREYGLAPRRLRGALQSSKHVAMH